jgi:STE24 endopeptidase
VKRNHVLKGVGWFALAIVPTAFLIALVTRRRGGMARPEAVPFALFALIAVQIATIPLQNVVSRHIEREADWIALETTRDPVAARDAFTELARASLSQPRPPGWADALFETHPAIMQRIEMTAAWQKRESARRRR